MARSKLSKFVGPEDISRVIGILDQNSQGRNIALVGGTAMQWYGSDRMTKDVDFVASYLPEVLETSGTLTFGGYKGKIEGIPVDVILRDDDYAELYLEALSTAASDPEIGSVRVVRPEYLAAMKLAAGRPKDEEDLVTLVNSGQLDLAKAQNVIKKYLGAYGLDSFNAVVDEAEWRHAKEARYSRENE